MYGFTTGAPRLSRLREQLGQPWDVAGLSVYRILFGAMMAVGLARFVAKGWVELVLVEPSYFFKFPGFGWVTVWSPEGLYLHFLLVILAAIAVSAGFFYRWSLIVFWLGFAYIQLLDVTLYLNHYYLVCLLSGLMAFMPLARLWSVDAWLRPPSITTVPAWNYLVLRCQVSLVYFFAALAKAHPDWLVYGEPMSTWVRASSELPWIGPWLELSYAGLLLSWAGFLYDLFIWVLLWIPGTRSLAFVLVLTFHLSTWLFFDIGMFPIIMIVSSTVFFRPDWPRRLIIGAGPPRSGPRRPIRRTTAVALGAYLVLQVLVPLRHFALPGPVLWNERGMRFAWKVMVREKNGSVTYKVHSDLREQPWSVSAMDYLTWRQFSDMSGQPDLILALGKHIAGDFERRGLGPLQSVTVEAWVSLNGRPPRQLVDPTIDLRTVDTLEDFNQWIRPAPTEPPPRARRLGY